MVKEVQNQTRLSGVCGENGPHSKYNEMVYSFPRKFFFILLDFLLSPFFFPSSSLSCVYFKHLSKGT